MRKFGVIGNPVDHSLSPMIHHEFAKEFDIELSYEKILSPVDKFSLTAEKFIASDSAGFNITLPFKINAYNFADDLTDEAKAAGAVNTIKLHNNMLSTLAKYFSIQYPKYLRAVSSSHARFVIIVAGT